MGLSGFQFQHCLEIIVSHILVLTLFTIDINYPVYIILSCWQFCWKWNMWNIDMHVKYFLPFMKIYALWLKPLIPGRCISNFQNVIFKLILQIDMNTSVFLPNIMVLFSFFSKCCTRRSMYIIPCTDCFANLMSQIQCRRWHSISYKDGISLQQRVFHTYSVLNYTY